MLDDAPQEVVPVSERRAPEVGADDHLVYLVVPTAHLQVLAEGQDRDPFEVADEGADHRAELSPRIGFILHLAQQASEGEWESVEVQYGLLLSVVHSGLVAASESRGKARSERPARARGVPAR